MPENAPDTDDGALDVAVETHDQIIDLPHLLVGRRVDGQPYEVLSEDGVLAPEHDLTLDWRALALGGQRLIDLLAGLLRDALERLLALLRRLLSLLLDGSRDLLGLCEHERRGDEHQHGERASAGEPGHCSWNELVTGDQDAALDFYGKLFGWRKTGSMPMGEMGDYTFIGEGDDTIGAMMNAPETGTRPFWNFAFTVEDIDAAKRAGQPRDPSMTHGDLTITAYDRVPDFARGNVRDLRLRWALNEAGFDHGVEILNPGRSEKATSPANPSARYRCWSHAAGRLTFSRSCPRGRRGGTSGSRRGRV